MSRRLFARRFAFCAPAQRKAAQGGGQAGAQMAGHDTHGQRPRETEHGGSGLRRLCRPRM